MKTYLLFFSFLIIWSTATAQKYAPIINQSFQLSDLAYMPKAELQQLKNEIILVKGADLEAITTQNPGPFALTTTQFLDSVSTANLELIQTLLQSQEESTSNCSHQEWFSAMIAAVKGGQPIPFYLQWYFLKSFPQASDHIYLAPVSTDFLTLAISGYDTAGQIRHHIFTFTPEGDLIDQLVLSEEVRLQDQALVLKQEEKVILTFNKEGELEKHYN